MSGENQFSDSFDEPNMEISVETLTGTSFDMRVCSNETVFNIKSKIQRVEGIPVHHQNLLFRMKELDDSKTLSEVGIVNGSILKLVLSMRGGPISTRRLSSCEHRVAWQDIKDLIEQAREEISESGSKISLFVFKEGDMVNLLRIIENENGTYSPYTETPADDIDNNISVLFDKLVEDNEMLRKISKVRKKIESVSTRRHLRNSRPSEVGPLVVEKVSAETEENVEESFAKPTADGKCIGQERLMYRVLKEFNDITGTTLQVPENSFKVLVNAPPTEVEEVALKEKHRSKFSVKHPSPSNDTESKPKSIYSESKGSFSLTKEKYLSFGPLKITQQKEGEEVDCKIEEENDGAASNATTGSREGAGDNKDASTASLAAATPTSCREGIEGEARRILMRNEPEGAAAVEVENDSELWDVSFLKRLRNVDYNFDVKYNVDMAPTTSPSSEVFRQNFYQLPQFVSTPATKEEQVCDYLLGNRMRSDTVHRSPLYGRRPQCTSDPAIKTYEKLSKHSGVPLLPRIHHHHHHHHHHLPSSASSNIERLRNDFIETKQLEQPQQPPQQQQQQPTTTTATNLEQLPLVVKKKQLRCNECNKRLNISNNYTCRCGRLFCAQHRYSETHSCPFDYKTEGRLVLERQNPLVVAEKLRKF